jgi:hypothetical protein
MDRNAPVAVNRAAPAASQRFSRAPSGSTAGHSFPVVAAPPATDVTLTMPQTLTDRSFRLSFTDTAGAFFGVVAAISPAVPLTHWSAITGLTEVSPGQV